MLSTLDLAQMRADALDLSEAGSGLSVEITIYRGTAVLAPQSVRLVSSGRWSNVQSDGTEAAQPGVSVVGAIDLDIRARDRFNVGGVAYEVINVAPNRYVQTTAQARALQ